MCVRLRECVYRELDNTYNYPHASFASSLLDGCIANYSITWLIKKNNDFSFPILWIAGQFFCRFHLQITGLTGAAEVRYGLKDWLL